MAAIQPKYRLFYLKGRGRAELIRLIFAYANRPYEDCRLTYGQWIDIKKHCDVNIFLPILEIDGSTVVTESLAIARLLSTEFGLIGTNIEETVKAEEIMAEIESLNVNLTPVVRTFLGKREDKKREEWNWFKRNHLNLALEVLTQVIKETRTGWLVGKRVTWADLAMVEFVTRLENCFDSFVLKDFPEIKTMCERLEKNPHIKAYIDERPHSNF